MSTLNQKIDQEIRTGRAKRQAQQRRVLRVKSLRRKTHEIGTDHHGERQSKVAFYVTFSLMSLTEQDRILLLEETGDIRLLNGQCHD